MEPYETRSILLPITLASAPSTISMHDAIKQSAVSSVSFRFNRFFPVTQSLARRGKRLHATKAQRLNATYGADTSLRIEIVPPRPRIRAEWVDLPSTAYEGEEVRIGLRVELVGGVQSVEALDLTCASPGVLRLPREDCELKRGHDPLSDSTRSRKLILQHRHLQHCQTACTATPVFDFRSNNCAQELLQRFRLSWTFDTLVPLHRAST